MLRSKMVRVVAAFILASGFLLAAFNLRPGAPSDEPIPVAQAAQATAYFDIDGIVDDASGRFGKFIPVLSFSQALLQTGSSGGGSGGGAGKVSFSDIRFRHKLDAASIKLMLAAASGQHISKATFVYDNSTGGKDSEILYKATLTDVVITSVKQVQSNGSQGPLSFEKLDASSVADDFMEEVSLNFSKIEWEYTSSGARVTGGYDLKSGQKL